MGDTNKCWRMHNTIECRPYQVVDSESGNVIAEFDKKKDAITDCTSRRMSGQACWVSWSVLHQLIPSTLVEKVLAEGAIFGFYIEEYYVDSVYIYYDDPEKSHNLFSDHSYQQEEVDNLRDYLRSMPDQYPEYKSGKDLVDAWVKKHLADVPGLKLNRSYLTYSTGEWAFSYAIGSPTLDPHGLIQWFYGPRGKGMIPDIHSAPLKTAHLHEVLAAIEQAAEAKPDSCVAEALRHLRRIY